VLAIEILPANVAALAQAALANNLSYFTGASMVL